MGKGKDAPAKGGKGKGDSSIDPSLQLPQMQISSAIQTVMELAYQTLSEIDRLPTSPDRYLLFVGVDVKIEWSCD
jgi:hypothetical protein